MRVGDRVKVTRRFPALDGGGASSYFGMLGTVVEVDTGGPTVYVRFDREGVPENEWDAMFGPDALEVVEARFNPAPGARVRVTPNYSGIPERIGMLGTVVGAEEGRWASIKVRLDDEAPEDAPEGYWDSAFLPESLELVVDAGPVGGSGGSLPPAERPDERGVDNGHAPHASGVDPPGRQPALVSGSRGGIEAKEASATNLLSADAMASTVPSPTLGTPFPCPSCGGTDWRADYYTAVSQSVTLLHGPEGQPEVNDWTGVMTEYEDLDTPEDALVCAECDDRIDLAPVLITPAMRDLARAILLPEGPAVPPLGPAIPQQLARLILKGATDAPSPS